MLSEGIININCADSIRKDIEKALNKLQKLSECSGGIFLGNDVKLQK